MPCSTVHWLWPMYCSKCRTTLPARRSNWCQTTSHGRSTICQSSIKWHTRWRCKIDIQDCSVLEYSWDTPGLLIYIFLVNHHQFALYMKFNSPFDILCWIVHNLLTREQNILLSHHLKNLFSHVIAHVIVDFIKNTGFYSNLWLDTSLYLTVVFLIHTSL